MFGITGKNSNVWKDKPNSSVWKDKKRTQIVKKKGIKILIIGRIR